MNSATYTDKLYSPSPARPTARQRLSEEADEEGDEVGSLHSGSRSPPRRKKGVARSGSITENVIESDGVRKVVLETNSSSEDADTEHNVVTYSNGKASKSTTSLLSATGLFHSNSNGSNENSDAGGTQNGSGEVTGTKKKKKRNRNKKSKNEDASPAN